MIVSFDRINRFLFEGLSVYAEKKIYCLVGLFFYFN